MKCEEVRDELVAYARGELSEARKSEVEEHLVRCAGCTAELEGARQVMAVTQMADEASITDLANRLIETAVQRRASDIHLEVANGGPRVRLRVDGVLQPGPEITLEQYEPLVARVQMMAGMNVSEKRLPQEGRIALTHEGRELDLRVSTVPYLKGQGVVIRILDRANVFLGLDRLGFHPQTLAQLQALLVQPNGLIITTGPTGAGKSTLLYSILNQLNRPEVKILTAEDPVEYLLAGVNQMAVNRRAGITFATAMRVLLRQDPDIFMVANLGDLETVEICVQAALTGHLVLTAMHTRDATGALTRLVDMGAEPFLVASSAIGVVGQRLARRVCPTCVEEYEPAASALRDLGFTAETRPASFTRGAGCNECHGSGYRGRVGLFELLTMDDELAHMVVERAPEASIRARALEKGKLWSFLADARAKVTDRTTTAEEAARALFDIATARTR